MHAAPHDLDGHSLLAVFAHPDDESIAAGGLLAWCAERGARVSLLCLSRGGIGPGAGADDLAATRARELADAARTLGIGEVVLLDHPDGMLPWLDDRVLETDVRRTIQRLQPEVVVTFDEDGLYWHPDHVATHDAPRAAVASLAGTAPGLYYATIPPGQMRAVLDTAAPRLTDAGARRDLLGISDADAFGASAPSPTLVLRTGRFAARRLAALRCHRTQVSGGPFDVIDAAEAEALLGVEHYRRADVGNAAATFLDRLAVPLETP
jgi:LmbE family N-acetylglucosaminyl deacetylase